MWRKNKETWQSSMFDISGKPTVDYGTTAEDIDKILKSVPIRKKIEWEPNIGTTSSELTETLIKEIDVSREAGFDEEQWLAGFVPFRFYDTGVVDHISTSRNCTLQECIDFYLKVIKRESGYWRFKDLIPHIEKYFTRFYWWKWDKESLEKYGDLIRGISSKCTDKIIVWLNWELDLVTMNWRFWDKATIDTVEKILKYKEPFDDLLLLKYLNAFFEKNGMTYDINVFRENKENIIEFFRNITNQTVNHEISYNLTDIWKDMWEAYTILLEIIFVSFDKFIWENRNGGDKYDFDSWREDRYLRYTELFRDTIRDIIVSLDDKFVESVRWIDFLVPMFASYRKLWENADIESVYKKNIVRRYLSWKWNANTIKWWAKQDRTMWLKKLLADDFPTLDYRNWRIFDENGNRIDKNEITNYQPEERKEKIEKWILSNKKGEQNKDIEEIGAIDRLENIIEESWLKKDITIDRESEYIVYKETGSMLNFVDIFHEESDCRKLNILERVEGEKESLSTEWNVSSEWSKEIDEIGVNFLNKTTEKTSIIEEEKPVENEDYGEDEDDDLPF